MATKGKSFKENLSGNLNPAMQFISTPTEEPERGAETKEPPKGYKANPLYIETKSRRVQLLLQPSLYEKLKAGAASHGDSVNEYVHSLLEDAMGAERREQ